MHLAVPEQRVARLQDPVVLVRKVHEPRGHALRLQHAVDQQALADRHAVVALAVDHQHGRVHATREPDGRPRVLLLDPLPHLAARGAAAALRHVARVLRRQVAHPSVIDDAPEAIGVTGDPTHQIAAVTATGHGHARLIDQARRDEHVGRVHDVAERPRGPLALDTLREVLSPPGRPLEVDQRHHIAGSRERLRVPARVPLVAERAVRTAVDHVHERVLLPDLMVGRQHHEHLHALALGPFEVHLAHLAGVV